MVIVNRQYSNVWVLQELGISKARQDFRIRKLGRLRDILEHPQENVQLRAAIAGAFRFCGGPVRSEFPAWLLQLSEDIKCHMDKAAARGYATITLMSQRAGSSLNAGGKKTLLVSSFFQGGDGLAVGHLLHSQGRQKL